MEQQQPDSTRPANVHQAHDGGAASVADALRSASFIPGPTPLQALEAQQRFMSAIASERARARDREADRRAR